MFPTDAVVVVVEVTEAAVLPKVEVEVAVVEPQAVNANKDAINMEAFSAFILKFIKAVFIKTTLSQLTLLPSYRAPIVPNCRNA
jgi:hypothetical protein